jgi:hypothetical protein
MNRTLSNLGPALFLAAVMLAASALAAAAPHSLWAAVAAPLLLALGLVGTDLVQRRRFRLSPEVLLLAAAILVACGIVASRGPDQLALMIAVFGSSVAIPVVLRPRGARTPCRWA